MAKGPIKLAMTMCKAVNFSHGCHVVLNTRRFYKEGDERMVNLYNLYDSWFSKDGEYHSQKLYTTSSSIYLCFFLQELMAVLNEEPYELPDNKGYLRSRSTKNCQDSIDYMRKLYGGKDGQ